MRYYRRNPSQPKDPPKKKLNIKNWLILGAVGVGGYLLYKNVVKKQLDSPDSALKNALSSGTGPDVSGPTVSKGAIYSTGAQTCIGSQVQGFAYAPIVSVNRFTRLKSFTATVNGHFTRRLLCKGSQQWAEIKPGI